MDGKIHARLNRQSVDAFLRRKHRTKNRRRASRLDGPPIWLDPATDNHTNRLIAAASSTRQNPPPRNRRIPSVLFPMHQLHHPRYPWLHPNKHCRRNRTRRHNGRLPFIFLRKQSQPKSQVLRKRHAIMRPHRRLVPVCVKSALTRCRILLPFQQRRIPPTARSRMKTSRTPQRRRPCHVNRDAPSPLVCDGSGDRRNIIWLPRRCPSQKFFIQPWTCSWSNPDHNGQCLLQRHFEQHC